VGQTEDFISHEPPEVAFAYLLERIDYEQDWPGEHLGETPSIRKQAKPKGRGGKHQSGIEVKPDD
jgi:hypothetical protein